VSPVDLVVVTLIVVGAGICAVLTTVAVSSLIQMHRVRREPRLAAVRQAVVVALSGPDDPGPGAFTGLSRSTRRYVSAVLLELAPSVNGTSRMVLNTLGERVGMLGRARRGIRSRRWSTRLYSARVLTALGVESDALVGLFDDTAPEVRAQAATWAVATPSPGAVAGLVGLLGDTDGLCRFAAQDALIRIGLPAFRALLDALASADDDVTGHILEIAAAGGDGRFAGPATDLCGHVAPRLRARAASALARTGDPAAGPVLVGLLDDPSHEVVLAAASGLAQLSYWPGAAEVEPLLSRPSWEVRRQAGLTLLALGDPGTVLLWANAPGDGQAADMSIQALQLRSLAAGGAPA